MNYDMIRMMTKKQGIMAMVAISTLPLMRCGRLSSAAFSNDAKRTAPVESSFVAESVGEKTGEILETSIPIEIDPYIGWEKWCESPIKLRCFKDEDCEPDRTGRPTECNKSKGALEGDSGKCKPIWLNKKRQKIQKENQRLIVDSICHPPDWWDSERDTEGKACWRFEWRTAKQCVRKHWCNPEKLHRFLRIPSKREATWDNQTDHSLNKDLIANHRSYRRMYYKGDKNPYINNEQFFEGLTMGKRGRPIFAHNGKSLNYKYCKPMDDNDIDPGPGQNSSDRNCNGIPDRWERGYGWYGTNAAIFTFEWDPNAPPEVLCRRVPSTLAVLRKARRAFNKLKNGVDCYDAKGRLYQADLMRDGKQERDYKKDTFLKPTWWLVHRAVWGGDICPSNDDGIGMGEWYHKMFNIRAKGVGLDPDEIITLEMLGETVAFEDQWELDSHLESRFAEIFPPRVP